jgi:hypothetical protein
LPSYRFIKCGNCGRNHESFGSPYEVIGTPYFTCFHCNRLNSQARIINEWDLKWDSEKRKYLFYMLFFSVFLGAGVGLMSVAIFSISEEFIWLSFGICWLLMYGLLFLYFNKQVEDSRKRLSNPDYLRTLIQLGILRSNSEIAIRILGKPPKT